MATRLYAYRDERGGSLRNGRAIAIRTPVERLDWFGDEAVVSLARRIYTLRRRRDENFGGELFSEPAWDILLYLFIAGAEGREVSVLSACAKAAAPQTTARRKLAQLEKARLIVREGDPADARRSYVRLSYLACRKMRGLLRKACPNGRYA